MSKIKELKGKSRFEVFQFIFLLLTNKKFQSAFLFLLKIRDKIYLVSNDFQQTGGGEFKFHNKL